MVVRVTANPSVPLPRNRPPEAPQRDQPALTPAQPERRPGSKEVAALEVRGKIFTNWTSVRVEARIAEPFPIFQFECTEEDPAPRSVDFKALTLAALSGRRIDDEPAQFVPGDVVRVFLGGMPVILGYITERHVGYDASNHGVKLVGSGDTADLVNSCVPLDKLGNHDGKSLTGLAQALAEHLGVAIHRRGNVDDTPFANIQVLPAETPMMAIERYAKMRNIVIGSEQNGGLALIGPHPVYTTGALSEGVNILRANAVFRDDHVFKKIFAIGQNTGSDQANGDPQNKMVAVVDGSSTRNRQMIVLADVADTMHGIQQRARMERAFTEGEKIEAQITVQGWYKPKDHGDGFSDEIWKAGEYYVVNSPSLILNGNVLGCAGCIYEQSDGGTTTTLTMKDPEHMLGELNYRSAALIYENNKRLEDKAKADAALARVRKP